MSGEKKTVEIQVSAGAGIAIAGVWLSGAAVSIAALWVAQGIESPPDDADPWGALSVFAIIVLLIALPMIAAFRLSKRIIGYTND